MITNSISLSDNETYRNDPVQLHLIVFSAKTEDALSLKLKDMQKWLSEGGSDHNVGDIAYTLLMGRSHFSVRCALVVENTGELEEKIKEALETGSAPGFYAANPGETGEKLSKEEIETAEKTLEMLGKGEFFERNAYRKQMDYIARLYVRGAKLAWECLFVFTAYRKIPMPTYPFTGEKYWISSPSENLQRVGNMEPQDAIHPMLDRNVSTFYEQCFEKTFTGIEFYFKDHVVGKDRVLPGVAYLEMARAAGDISLNSSKVMQIRNVFWINPIKMEDNREKYKVAIKLFPVSQHEAEFEVFTLNGDMQVVNAYGNIVFDDIPKRDDLYVDIEAVKKRCEETIGMEECYRRFEKRGLYLGKSFRSILELKSGGNEAIARIKIPDSLNSSLKDYRLHPILMDGALETVIGLVEHQNGHENGLSLPYAMDEVKIFADLEADCYAYASEASKNGEDSPEDRKFDVTVLDKKGRVLVEMKGFTLRTQQIGTVEDDRENELMYYRPEWEFSQAVEPDTVRGDVLIFDEGDELYRQAVATGRFSGNVVLARPGRRFRQMKNNIIEFNISEPEDYRKIFEHLEKKKIFPQKVIHALSRGGFPENEEILELQLQRSFYSMFYLAQVFLDICSGQAEVLYMFPEEDGPAPQHSAMGAFLKTVKLENFNLKARSIGIAGSYNPAAYLEAAVKEFASGDEDTEVRYEASDRYVRRIKEFSPDSIYEKGLKDGGVYLVTGGAGGLGLMIAEDIVKNYEAMVILAGRSEPELRRLEKIESLNRYRGKAEYMRADVSNPADVAGLVGEIKRRYGKINGVIHAAGILKDAYFLKKSYSEMRDVIAPKIMGTLYIDEATRNENLDFMVFFSSISAVGGNAGQADYSYANSFMDYYALTREVKRNRGERSGKTVSINWSLWKDGGMKVDEQTEILFKSTMGIAPLPAGDGIEAFYRALNANETQLACVYGKREKIETVLGNRKEEMSKEFHAEYDCGMLLEKVTERIIESVMSILKVRKKDVQLNRDMSEYGFNSITFTDLANHLNREFSLNLTPAVFFEHSTVDSVARYVVEIGGGKLAEKLITEGKANDGQDAVKPNLRSEKEMSMPGKKQRTGLLKAFSAMGDMTVSYKAAVDREEPIAIIGMSGIMPQSEDLDEFWHNLENERDLITEIPSDRWNWKAYYSEDNSCPNTTFAKWGGFMKEVDKFDSAFFGISPREAELMDPQQRIFMETIWKTIEMAGYKPSYLSGTKTGLFVGVSTMDYYDLMKENGINIEAHLSTGISHCVLANRISYLLNINGPSEPIDTACSSSLVAIHRAVEAIRNGDCEMAFAGGINVILSPMLYIAFGKAGMLSRDGRCKTFDRRANGYVRGEGSGAIWLKPLKKAIADGDYIYAIIRSTAVNHGGKANTLTSPNPNAQAELLYKAYEKAGIDPTTVGYIETHGTGTQLGDPIEINALNKAFSMLYEKWKLPLPSKPYCGLGSVKTNIGHLETAAGIAGVLKVILAMKHKKLPGNVHFNELNPYIQLEGSPFYIVDRTMKWEAIKDKDGRELPRRAGLSSFGFGGTNAHVVLEEYPNNTLSIREESKPRIFVLSAKNEERLKEYAKRLADYLDMQKDQGQLETDPADDNTVENIRNTVLKSVAEITCVSETSISTGEPLEDLGIDIIAANRLFEMISERFGFEFDAKTLLEYQTLEHIVLKVADGIKRGNGLKIRDTRKSDSKPGMATTAGLEEIAYTLQVGREAMDERLAVIANSREELVEKLREFLEKNNLLNGVYRGNVKDSSNKAGLLLDGRVGKEFLRIIVEDGELPKLAQLWVMGVSLDWTFLYSGKRPTRVALPTYPFERKRHWFDSFRRKSPGKSDSGVEVRRGPAANVSLPAMEWEELAESYNGDEVRLEILDGCIALVRMEDRQNRNMFTEGIILGLLYAFKEIKRRESIKAIIVTGYDNVFCMGGTREQLMGIADRKSKFTDIPFLYRGFLDADVPVISAVQGHASGGGLMFALYGDIVVMAEEGVYGAVFTKYGFTPGMGATFLLKEKLGVNLATEMMFTAKSFSGAELRNRGASVIFKPASDVLSEAIAIARLLAEKPTSTLKVLKKELSGRILEQLPYYLQRETEMHEETFSNSEVRRRIERYYGSTLGNRDVSAVADGNNKNAGNMEKTGKECKAGDMDVLEMFLEKLLNDVERGIITPEQALSVKKNVINTIQGERYER